MKHLIRTITKRRSVLIPLLLLAGLSGCHTTGPSDQALVDKGYQRGRADELKRLYWLRQRLEAEPKAPENGGRIAYYTLPAQVETADGRLLVEHRVSVPIIE